MTLGELIRKYRKANNYSIYDVAKSVGISHSYINQIEQGKKRNPDSSILVKLALELSIPLEEIIKIKLNEMEAILNQSQDKLIPLTETEKSTNVGNPSTSSQAFDLARFKRKLCLLKNEDLLKVQAFVDSLADTYSKP